MPVEEFLIHRYYNSPSRFVLEVRVGAPREKVEEPEEFCSGIARGIPSAPLMSW